MIDLDFVKSLIKALDESGVDSIEIERGGTRIRLAKTPRVDGPTGPPSLGPSAPPVTPTPPTAAQDKPVPSPAPAGAGLIEIRSPMVGTFYRSPAPDAAPYVEVGATVSPGLTLCIIEAMKLMNELECEVSGVIRDICVENGEPVEFGQVLFRVSQ